MMITLRNRVLAVLTTIKKRLKNASNGTYDEWQSYCRSKRQI